MPFNVTLGAYFDRLIEELVRSGRFADAEEVIHDGLRLIEERERRLGALDAAIARGVDDADAGRVLGIDEARSQLRDESLRTSRQPA